MKRRVVNVLHPADGVSPPSEASNGGFERKGDVAQLLPACCLEVREALFVNKGALL